MTIDVDFLGRRIRQLRELKGQSLSGLADDADVSKSYLAKLERGEIDNPGLKTLYRIAVALGVTLAELLPNTTEDADESQEPTGPVATSEYERLLEELPQGLKAFLEQKEEAGDRLSADEVKSLASIQFRGKKPQGIEDWQFLYDAIKRSL